MAIYTGNLPIVGRIDMLSFYRVEGQTRVRVRNPLSRKRVLKSPRFKNTRMHADWLARASTIGSLVYRALPDDFRQYWMYRAFVGEAMQLLKKEMTDEEVLTHLRKIYVEVNYVRPVVKEDIVESQQTKPLSKQSTPLVKRIRTIIASEAILFDHTLLEHTMQMLHDRKHYRWQSSIIARAA